MEHIDLSLKHGDISTQLARIDALLFKGKDLASPRTPVDPIDVSKSL